MTADALRRWCLARPARWRSSRSASSRRCSRCGKISPQRARVAPLRSASSASRSSGRAARHLPAIQPGYHLNKRHWVTITLTGRSRRDALELLEDSSTSWSQGCRRGASASRASARSAAGAATIGPCRSRAGRRGVSESREQRRERLVEVYQEASVCTKCPLAETRTKVVFGSGNADAELMFVGEAPGAEEDRQGLPFVGRAGALLTELLEGIGHDPRARSGSPTCCKCRPPGNRDPQPIEIESCQPYTHRQVELIEPRVIATLGNFATKLLDRQPGRDQPRARHAAGPRDRRPHGLPDAALPSGGGAADALARRHPARGLRQAARAARAARPRGRGVRRRPRSSPEAPRLAPTSSTCSVDDTSSAPVPRRRRRSGRGWPPAFGPATWCWSAGSSAPARRP